MTRALGCCLFDTAIGACGIAWTEQAMAPCNCPRPRAKARLRACAALRRSARRRRRRLRAAGDRAHPALLQGTRDDLRDLPLDLAEVPDFHQRVYEMARAIPPGEVLTYGEVAKRLGEPGAARAVGQALGTIPSRRWCRAIACWRRAGARAAFRPKAARHQVEDAGDRGGALRRRAGLVRLEAAGFAATAAALQAERLQGLAAGGVEHHQVHLLRMARRRRDGRSFSFCAPWYGRRARTAAPRSRASATRRCSRRRIHLAGVAMLGDRPIGRPGTPARVASLPPSPYPLLRARRMTAPAGSAAVKRGAKSRQSLAVPHQLRRVDVAGAGCRAAPFALARRVRGRGEAVDPADVVPVADVEGLRHHLRPRAALLQRGEPAVRRRAGTAALGGVQLDDGRAGGRRLRAAGSGLREAPQLGGEGEQSGRNGMAAPRATAGRRREPTLRDQALRTSGASRIPPGGRPPPRPSRRLALARAGARRAAALRRAARFAASRTCSGPRGRRGLAAPGAPGPAHGAHRPRRAQAASSRLLQLVQAGGDRAVDLLQLGAQLALAFTMAFSNSVAAMASRSRSSRSCVSRCWRRSVKREASALSASRRAALPASCGAAVVHQRLGAHGGGGPRKARA
jgi:methylated-DNA-[protein]-cysteine S-methyltransferase